MTDLELLAELAAETPLPSDAALTPARTRLLVELHAAGTGVGPAAAGSTAAARTLPGPTAPAMTGAGSGRPWPRWVAVAGIAAAVTAGVVTLTTTPRWDDAPPASAAAADVLDRAAAAARSAPEVRPRPDQFLYVRSAYRDGVYEAWLTVDGTQDGRIRPVGSEPVPIAGCRGGLAPVYRGTQRIPGATEPCVPDPAYLPGLPTTADDMLGYLRRSTDGANRDDSTNDMAKQVWFLAELKLLRPAARAALFEAAKRIPGVTIVPDATDGAGRPGIGVAWTHEGGPPVMLVFDRTTYRLLGSTDESLQRQVVVDRVGQRG
jgi:hypothetical protein